MERDIVRGMIAQPGQSQDKRLAPELDRDDPAFVVPDERSVADLLRQAATFAYQLPFYKDTPAIASGDWGPYFSGDSANEAITPVDGNVAPHLGLFRAFLNLYDVYTRDSINAITARHLDYQYGDVLHFEQAPAQPDHAHVVVELKKDVAQGIAMKPDRRFTAGKDASGVERLYAPVREYFVGKGVVDKLHNVFHDANGVFFGAIAESSDGLGGKLADDKPGWLPFGDENYSEAHIGFAVASPVLRLADGPRGISIEVTLSNPPPDPASLATGTFEAYATGPKGWLGPIPVLATRWGDVLRFVVSIGATSPAVVDFDAAIHGSGFAAFGPIVQVLLKPGTALRYDALSGLCVGKIRIHVDADALTTLDLENDYGTLNPKKAFLPFGAQPVVGSRFFVGSTEALSKDIQGLKLRLTWQGAPSDLAAWYSDYPFGDHMKDGVSADFLYEDRSGNRKTAVMDIMARDATGTTTLDPSAPPPAPLLVPSKAESHVYAFSLGGAIAKFLGLGFAQKNPVLLGRYLESRAAAPPETRSGFITIALKEDFQHADYRVDSIQKAQAGRPPLREPYTPKVQAISLAYSAHADEVDVASHLEDDFTNLDVQFFHVGCFGPMREHGFLRAQAEFVQDKRVTLLPRYEYEGELLIALTGVGAGDGLCLLFQCAEGSADPDLEPQHLEWSVLCDNYWRALTPQELSLDTSADFRRSGIVSITLPHETTTQHTWLETGRVWIRAGVRQSSGAACRLIKVAANGLEVARVALPDDDTQAVSPAAPGSIAKLKVPDAAVKSVSQPYAGFGGKPKETRGHLAMRAAERLRHRQRCITPWDYERMVLEAFPGIHRVKCIPHSSLTSWLAAGHVMIVVVPDLRNPNAIDPLRPRADIDTLERIRELVARYCGMGVQVHVRNPRFQAINLDFKVRFYPGRPFNFYREVLNRDLVQMMAPWACITEAGSSPSTMEFGGRVFRSVLLDFVEDREYVDFVTDFRMGSTVEGEAPIGDAPEITVDRPDAILTPAARHAIAEVLDA